ncbi:MAG: hypothetical protein QNK03_27380 [Myxococcota bacterium]|nr:hypothetical protein [Myxococcota bacterium]
MTRRSTPLAVLVLPLLLVGCLYTKSMVEKRFYVQVLDCAGGTVTIDNRSGKAIRVCAFGDTASFCETSEVVADGERLPLDFARACTAKPIPDHPCSHDKCLTVRRAGADLAPEDSEYVEIGGALGLHVSLRPVGFTGNVDPVVVTNSVTSPNLCYRVLVLPPDADDRQAIEMVDDEEDDETRALLAKTRSDPVECE